MRISIQHLTKIFPSRNRGGKAVHAVEDMNIEIPSGGLVGLLGPSGCGKSTTLFMLSGLESPSSGKILFDDQDVTTLAAEKRGVGLVFQNYALYPHMTVQQNIRFPLDNMRIKKEEGNARALDAARLVQIEDLMARKPSELSGGQQQRVAIARALVKMPNVLLLDEPLSNLDARLRLQTREEIKRIQRTTGITTVFVTHDQEEAMSICDTMVVMKLGIVQQVGAPQDIYDDPNNLFVANFLGTPPINIFKGKIAGGKVYIGEEAIGEAPWETPYDDQDVFVGIRPEGFIYDANGAFTLNVDHIEVMGRDKSVVASHECSTKPIVRSIIDSDIVLPASNQLKFNVKPNKLFLFSAATEERVKYPANVFKGKIEGGKIYIGEEAVADTQLEDREVYIGICPDGFVYDENGALTLQVNSIEEGEGSKTLAAAHTNSEKPGVKCIIGGAAELPAELGALKFNIKPNKLSLYDAETRERLSNGRE